MFCFQCQETAQGKGCTIAGVCGKKNDTAQLQDVLIFVLKGIARVAQQTRKYGALDIYTGRFITDALFATITNVNFDNDTLAALIREALQKRDTLIQSHTPRDTDDSVTWHADSMEALLEKAQHVGILATQDEDVRSLRALLILGLKGIAAYATHAAVLGFEKQEIYDFIVDALASTTHDLSTSEMLSYVMKAGEVAVETMALLDEANTTRYGKPTTTMVNIGVCNRPAILISGHDLKDMEMLLEQTQDTGVDVYTHGEMLPAHYYPFFKKYKNLVGNYGNAWWKQQQEFELFNGPILMTTNCLVPVKDSYKHRIFTTGVVRYPGVHHIVPTTNGYKDFSAIIALAKTCPPPTQIETGSIVGGFAHDHVMMLADKIIDAVKSGAIKRFVVMAGCDARHPTRDYFTQVALQLPKDAVILTAGCAKYRYNKLNLGDINGIPRVLDAGQCNDSYSLAVIALKLKEAFGLDDVNKLPLSFDIAWYEQKAVAVLLALLWLGFKNIRLGPTLPAFVSPKVLDVLVKQFDLKPTTDATQDVAAMMAGK